jgi:hypothetical protein
MERHEGKICHLVFLKRQNGLSTPIEGSQVMFEKIPFQRALIYIMIACLLPAFFVGIYLFFQLKSLDQLGMKIDHVESLALQQEKRQATNLTVMNHFRDADHFYIDKYLEVLNFLEPEVEALQKITQHKNFNDDEVIKKRLEFLSGSSNALRFSEGVVQTFPQFQETAETLIHPVEVNVQDIQKILALIEGVNIGPYQPAPNRPQLIILDFKLEKKRSTDKNEVFLLNMKLLKREFA